MFIDLLSYVHIYKARNICNSTLPPINYFNLGLTLTWQVNQSQRLRDILCYIFPYPNILLLYESFFPISWHLLCVRNLSKVRMSTHKPKLILMFRINQCCTPVMQQLFWITFLINVSMRFIIYISVSYTHLTLPTKRIV